MALCLLDLEASALDPAGPVSITVDLGGQKKVSAVDILWEFPAKSFAVSVSTDGTKWSEVHATDSNILSSSSIALGSTQAAKVRVVMHEVGGSLHCSLRFAAVAFFAKPLTGSRVFPWACCVWHQVAGCAKRPLADHSGRLRRGSQKHRCPRQVFCHLR